MIQNTTPPKVRVVTKRIIEKKDSDNNKSSFDYKITISLILTLTYLVMCGISLIYNVHLWKKFGIKYIDYIDISDLFISYFRHNFWSMLLITLNGCNVVALFRWLIKYIIKQYYINDKYFQMNKENRKDIKQIIDNYKRDLRKIFKSKKEISVQLNSLDNRVNKINSLLSEGNLDKEMELELNDYKNKTGDFYKNFHYITNEANNSIVELEKRINKANRVKFLKPRVYGLIIPIVVIVFVSMLIVLEFKLSAHNILKNNRSESIIFKNVKINKLSDIQLLGNTSKYSFFYDKSSKQSIIVPSSEILYIKNNVEYVETDSTTTKTIVPDTLKTNTIKLDTLKPD